MSRPLRLHLPGGLHHVFARGDNKGSIFMDDQDYETFLEVLAPGLDRFGVVMIGYCLLWNHYHLALVPQKDPLSRLMQQLNSNYCQGFNRRHGRVGHVLQGRYGSRLVEEGDYARTLLRYLALNPVAAGQVNRPEDWEWSSYRAALGLVPASRSLSLDSVWSAFGTTEADLGRVRLADFVRASVQETFDNPLLHGSGRLAGIVAPELEPHQSNRDFTYSYRFAARLTLGALLECCTDRRSTEDAACNAYHRHGYTLAEIGAALNRDPSTICRWIQRARSRQDPA